VLFSLIWVLFSVIWVLFSVSRVLFGCYSMLFMCYDSLGESGLLTSSGGSESLEEFLERGPYYHYSFTRDAEDRSTQVQLSTTFSTLEAGANIFLVSWYSRAIELTTTGGQIQSVRSLSV